MGIERLRAVVEAGKREGVVVVYGEGVRDIYVGAGGEEIGIEEALGQELREAGYEEVEYMAPHRPLYRVGGEGGERGAKVRLGEGPLGGRMLVRGGEVGGGREAYEAIGDLHALRLVDGKLKGIGGERTAVVIMQAEALLGHFEDRRTLSGVVGEWMRRVEMRGMVVMVFTAEGYEELSEVGWRQPVPELRSVIMRRGGGGLVQVKGGGEDEIRRLVGGAEMVREMVREGLRIREWLGRIEEGWEAGRKREGVVEQMEKLVGLDGIKERIRELRAWLMVEQERGGKRSEQQLHMVFVGNPGTGKTTVARLVGEMYYELGLLKRGHVVEVKGGDLVAEHVGGTAIKTNGVVDEALDGVLFIDEAYTLTEDGRGGFGREAVEALLTRMEDERGRLVVIAAGYGEEMGRFMRSNPGLRRRFGEENVLVFEDYRVEELQKILKGMVEERGMEMDRELEGEIGRILKGMVERRGEGYGNGGEVRNLVDVMERRRAVRIVDGGLGVGEELREEDVPEMYRVSGKGREEEIERVVEEIEGQVGMREVKRYVRGLVMRERMAGARQERGLVGDGEGWENEHLVIEGGRGTGKTEVGRKIGALYRAIGRLKGGQVVTVGRGDLIGGYEGQTAGKVRERMKEAEGGVLLVEGAGRLIKGGYAGYGIEALDELARGMGEGKKRMVVILEGEKGEMDELLERHGGLRGEIGRVIEIEGCDGEELGEMLRRKAEGEGYEMGEGVQAELVKELEMEKEREGDRFGNGWAVRRMYERMKEQLAERLMGDGDERLLSTEALTTFTIQDVPVVKRINTQLIETKIIQSSDSDMSIIWSRSK